MWFEIWGIIGVIVGIIFAIVFAIQGNLVSFIWSVYIIIVSISLLDF